MTPVVIVVPFRPQEGMDRPAHLSALLERLALLVPCIPVVVAQQTDDGRPFHRGALLNAGFCWSMERWPGTRRIIFHDVDLLPDADVAARYAEEPFEPFECLATVPGCRYAASPGFVGGVTAVTPEAFERMNGFPISDAWGWGGEDDELRRRAETCGVPVVRNTSGSYTDLEGTNIAAKLAWLRVHRDQKNMRRYELRDAHTATWEHNGLRSEHGPSVVDVQEDAAGVRLLVNLKDL